uniref:Uncharacterized protein n=1 Tax=Triticum urartu TaxID=4572 RepID=A0A8R7TNZ7_TRIUA
VRRAQALLALISQGVDVAHISTQVMNLIGDVKRKSVCCDG